MEFSIPDFHNFFGEQKRFFFKKIAKDDQNGLIRPEN